VVAVVLALVVIGAGLAYGAVRLVTGPDELSTTAERPISVALSPTIAALPTDAAETSPEAPQSELNITGLLGNQPVSQNWAGYAATAGGYTAVSAT
jgi:hypothetical protein